MIEDSDVFTMTLDRRNPEVIHATACSGIYRSANGAARWSRVYGIPFGSRRSRAFAQEIATLRDRGVRRLVFLIGGADGLAPELLAEASGKLAFGPQTWPHAMARAMLAEQVYRAVTILAGSPYHRD